MTFLIYCDVLVCTAIKQYGILLISKSNSSKVFFFGKIFRYFLFEILLAASQQHLVVASEIIYIL